MKLRFLLPFVFLLILSTLAFAQDLSWSEIKLSQEKERQLLETTQKDFVDKLVSRQADELYRLRSSDSISTQEITNLLQSHKEERLALIKQFSEERTKLTEIHANERKEFLQSQKKGESKNAKSP